MSLLFILLTIITTLIFLTAVLKISPFISFILVTILAGILLGMPLGNIVQSFQKGIGDMLGSILVTLTAGAMLGKLVAESGAATVIADKIIAVCGKKYLQWGLLLTGLIIGIPLFYNVGFVLIIPIVFTLSYRYKLPAVYVGIPMLAALSVAHSLLPPHPSPASLVGTFQASMIKTFLYGIAVAVPAIILAGPVFARTLRHIQPQGELPLVEHTVAAHSLPGVFNSIFSALLPVFLLLTTFLLSFIIENKQVIQVLSFIKEPSVLMLLSLLVVSITLGTQQRTSMKHIMRTYEAGIKDIAMILLIIGASGGLKQVLIDSEASIVLAGYFQSLQINPLILGWLIAAIIRLCLGSATVAGLTAAGIIAPLMPHISADPNLMILAIGAGSIFCSHVNDTGFWMFKEYFNVSIKDTFLSWTIMESIVSVAGLAGVLLLSIWL
ncbi:gluconate:H+ symporter [Cytophaga hutchinsonii]|uniref:High-affinity gluconate transporter n=1 Tax=Cytophaga hutchinsonii (strain ATCC 33406 / DSM 1761 / CIP 103989 / NBRC 15051 / NCIMB 9469 / D465) TaxID=269798 RepID=A0A6N4SQQ1_CYTH3|nr:gluconate:H+ symporter [Cytophaga hutchinsonii]ABG58674.1 high-affinity gluconate transporter [Cytophaga hutchinsonii ATCC 33406]SFX59364.1 Gnt-I system high-affinity gluconate transporter [Cytophaga hutchinsonii ATCC 33406]